MGTYHIPLDATTFSTMAQSEDGQLYQVQTGFTPEQDACFFRAFDAAGNQIPAAPTETFESFCARLGFPMPGSLVHMVLDKVLAHKAAVPVFLHATGMH